MIRSSVRWHEGEYHQRPEQNTRIKNNEILLALNFDISRFNVIGSFVTRGLREGDFKSINAMESHQALIIWIFTFSSCIDTNTQTTRSQNEVCAGSLSVWKDSIFLHAWNCQIMRFLSFSCSFRNMQFPDVWSKDYMEESLTMAWLNRAVASFNFRRQSSSIWAIFMARLSLERMAASWALSNSSCSLLADRCSCICFSIHHLISSFFAFNFSFKSSSSPFNLYGF